MHVCMYFNDRCMDQHLNADFVVFVVAFAAFI